MEMVKEIRSEGDLGRCLSYLAERLRQNKKLCEMAFDNFSGAIFELDRDSLLEASERLYDAGFLSQKKMAQVHKIIERTNVYYHSFE